MVHLDPTDNLVNQDKPERQDNPDNLPKLRVNPDLQDNLVQLVNPDLWDIQGHQAIKDKPDYQDQPVTRDCPDNPELPGKMAPQEMLVNKDWVDLATIASRPEPLLDIK